MGSNTRACVEGSVLPIGILYEHPQWFTPLFAELDRRGLPYEKLDATRLRLRTGRPRAVALVGRQPHEPSAWTRGHGPAIFHTLHYLPYLDASARRSQRLRAYELELSKARQASLLAELGIAHPRTRVVADPTASRPRPSELRLSVLVKTEHRRQRRRHHRRSVARASSPEASARRPDRRHACSSRSSCPRRGDAIVRYEILDGESSIAIRILLLPGSFNLCPADYCELPGWRTVSPDAGSRSRRSSRRGADRGAKRIVRAGGPRPRWVEYLVERAGPARRRSTT
jgi:hypothetical protein